MKGNSLNRRKFFYLFGVGSLAVTLQSFSKLLTGKSGNQNSSQALIQAQSKPATNISDAAKVPGISSSMPLKR